MGSLTWLDDIIAVSEKVKEKRKKAIPSKVFFNHFFAINYQIQSNTDKYLLKNVEYYSRLKINNASFDLEKVRKLLWNSWSTENAFKMTSKAENDDFYRFALHWLFPQAYYSIYLAMTAFHETQGMANDVHEKSIKVFGNSIKDSHYPEVISFYVSGLYKDFEFNGLKLFNGFKEGFNSLTRIESLEDAQSQIASFLKTTRKQNAENKRKRGAKNYSKDARFQTKKGKFRKTFGKDQWDIIYESIPETSLLNMIYRLRIKANYHDIETFINADIDFSLFHECIENIIAYLNFVHEAYIHKAVGDEIYKEILYSFNGHVIENGAKKRYEELIMMI